MQYLIGTAFSARIQILVQFWILVIFGRFWGKFGIKTAKNHLFFIFSKLSHALHHWNCISGENLDFGPISDFSHFCPILAKNGKQFNIFNFTEFVPFLQFDHCEFTGMVHFCKFSHFLPKIGRQRGPKLISAD